MNAPVRHWIAPFLDDTMEDATLPTAARIAADHVQTLKNYAVTGRSPQALTNQAALCVRSLQYAFNLAASSLMSFGNVRSGPHMQAFLGSLTQMMIAVKATGRGDANAIVQLNINEAKFAADANRAAHENVLRRTFENRHAAIEAQQDKPENSAKPP